MRTSPYLYATRHTLISPGQHLPDLHDVFQQWGEYPLGSPVILFRLERARAQSTAPVCAAPHTEGPFALPWGTAVCEGHRVTRRCDLPVTDYRLSDCETRIQVITEVRGCLGFPLKAVLIIAVAAAWETAIGAKWIGGLW